MLRRAKTTKLSKSSQLPSQSRVAKRVTPATKPQGVGQGEDSKDQERHLRDLTSVLGKRVAKETSRESKVTPKERKTAKNYSPSVEARDKKRKVFVLGQCM